MHIPSVIRTIKSSTEFRFKEKGSEFIGFASPVQNVKEAENILFTKKKEFYDATHTCYGYKIVPNIEKYSDDGEPSGTAGIRIINAIQHFDLTNLVVIVTRYYGGKKLGVGPLGKAYYNTAQSVLQSAKIISKENYSYIDLTYDFENSKTVHHFLNVHNCLIKQNKFEENAVISFLIKPEKISEFESDIKSATKGKIVLTLVEDGIYI